MNTDRLIRDIDGDLFVGSSRVLLQNLVVARKRGETPEQMRDNFPGLSLAQIYGAIVYYLEHQDVLDAKFLADELALDEAHAANYSAHAEFFDAMRARFEAARAQRGEETSKRASGA